MVDLFLNIYMLIKRVLYILYMLMLVSIRDIYLEFIFIW